MSFRDRFRDWVKRNIVDTEENLWPETQPLDDDVPEPEPEPEPSCRWCGTTLTIPPEYSSNPNAALHCVQCDRPKVRV